MFFNDYHNFKFIARKDSWFVESSECKLLLMFNNEFNLKSKVDTNSGLFQGITNEIFESYTGILPRLDEEGCNFDEFDIYYKDEQINDWTYEKLFSKINEK